MSSENNVFGIVSLVISGFALCISGISMIINIKKFRLEKSKLHAEITRYWMTGETAAYPSMENDNSKYVIHVSIENSGYKEELIKRIVFYYEKSQKSFEITRMVKAKSREDFSFDFTRMEIMKLVKIVVIPTEDRQMVINRKELRKWQNVIVQHIDMLQKEWKDGRKIEKSI